MFGIQCRNLKRVHDAGMIIGLGTDANADIGWGAHTELADMVFCGLTPAEALVAGTRASAQILKLDQLPHSTIVVGAGVTGIESAIMLATLGVQVTIVDAKERILDSWDTEIADTLVDHARSLGIVFRLGDPL